MKSPLQIEEEEKARLSITIYKDLSGDEKDEEEREVRKPGGKITDVIDETKKLPKIETV